MHWSVVGMLAEKVKVNNVTSNKIKWYTKSHPRHAWQIEFNESNEIKKFCHLRTRIFGRAKMRVTQIVKFF